MSSSRYTAQDAAGLQPAWRSPRAYKETASEPDVQSSDYTVSSRDTAEIPRETGIGSGRDTRSVSRIGSAEDIYPAPEAGSREFIAAMKLLRLAIDYTDAALAEQPGTNPIASDYELSKVRALLPELFCCRSLGDGYGMSIAAIAAALENQQLEPLSAAQLNAIRSLFKALRERPWMRTERAIEEIEKLEDAALDVTPKGLQKLHGLLDD